MGDFLTAFAAESEDQIKRIRDAVSQLKIDVQTTASTLAQATASVGGSGSTSALANNLSTAQAAANNLTATTRGLTTATQAQQSAEALLAQTIQQANGTLEGNARQQAQLRTELANVMRELRTLTSATNVYGQAVTTNRDRVAQLTVEEATLRNALNSVNATIRAQVAGNNAAATSYDALTSRLRQASLAYNQLTVAERNSASGQALQGEIAGIRNQLTQLDAGLGTSTRNVGNYQSAFSKAFTGLRTLANILPGIGISGLLLVGVEAIQSIYEYAKGLDSAKTSFDALAEGLKSSDYKNAISSFAELKENVKLAQEGLLDKDEVTKNYNNTLGKTIGLAKDFNEVEAIASGKAGEAYIRMTLYKATAVQLYAKAAEAAADAQLSFARASSGQNDFFSLANAANVVGGGLGVPGLGFASQAAVNAKQANKALDLAKLLEKQGDDYQKMMAEVSDKFNFNPFGDNKKEKSPKGQSEDAGINALEAAQKRKEELIFNGKKYEQEIISEVNKTIYQDETKSYEERVIAYNKFEEAQKQIVRDEDLKIELQNQEHLNALLSKQTAYNEGKIKLSAKGYEALLLEIDNAQEEERQQTARANYNITKIDEQGYRDRQRIWEDESHQRLLAAQNEIAEQLRIQAEGIDAQQKALKVSYDAGKITKKQYDLDLKNLSITSKDQTYQIQIDALNNQLLFSNLTRKDYDETKKKIDELVAKQKELAEGQKANGGFTKDTYLDLTRKGIAITQELKAAQQDQFNARLKQLDIENDKIDRNLQDQIAAINLSGKTSIEKEQAIAEAEAQAQSAREQLASRQADIKRQQARAQKQNDISSIISGTAVAVVAALGSKPYTPANIGLAIATGLLGAAQLARAIAAPIPEYEEGTEFHPGGPAKVHRGEIVVDKNKTWYTGSARETLLPDLSRGARVIPKEEVDAMVWNSMYGAVLRPKTALYVTSDNSDIKDAVNNQTKSIVKAIQHGYIKPKTNIFGSNNRKWVNS